MRTYLLSSIRRSLRAPSFSSSTLPATFAVLCALGVIVGGCARGPAVAVDGLALRRVVIYRNGVGYFERAGHITESEVTFKVRGNEVDDFLATLAVIEQGGSSVRSASFPIKVAKPGDASWHRSIKQWENYFWRTFIRRTCPNFVENSVGRSSPGSDAQNIKRSTSSE